MTRNRIKENRRGAYIYPDYDVHGPARDHLGLFRDNRTPGIGHRKMVFVSDVPAPIEYGITDVRPPIQNEISDVRNPIAGMYTRKKIRLW